MRDEALERAITEAGGVAALARAINVTSQAISQWDRVPAERVIAVEAASGGRVSRHELRADLYPAGGAVGGIKVGTELVAGDLTAGRPFHGDRALGRHPVPLADRLGGDVDGAGQGGDPAGFVNRTIQSFITHGSTFRKPQVSKLTFRGKGTYLIVQCSER